MKINNSYISNIIWLFIDKFFLLFGGLVVTVIVAKFLGPDLVGVISYGITLGGIALTISQWGGTHTIYNVATRKPESAISLIKSTEKKRLVLYIFVWVFISFWVVYTHGTNYQSLIIISMVLSSVFLSLDLYQYYNNANLRSKYNARSSMISKSISMLIRITMVYFEAEVWLFVLPYFIEAFLIYQLRKMSIEEKIFVKNSRYSDFYLKSGVSLVSSSILIYIYSKINEIILAEYLSFEDVGFYTIAFVLSSAWTFIPLSIGISLMTKPLKNKNNDSIDYAFPLLSMIVVSVPILFFVWLYSDFILDITFGQEYTKSSELLFILCCSTLLTSLGYVNNRLITSFKGGGRYLLWKSIVSVFVSIIMSLFFINKYGLIGASYSFLLIEFLNLTIFNYFFSKGSILRIHSKIFISTKQIRFYVE
ncbi:oligosaccharide flippase family protein [Vibrio cyclitrophicus]|uniref:Oligosaccharide flippase family protein n=1 Tax=Vibrio cyclitrophicus ZF270 TaxID=1136176 RepID=A0AAN0LL88_9VIBR|nr:oligosaccharide flippase family protein [Vibrio cyclitrophicus]OEE04265.1 hypothetical protein OC7_10495 [Vibrio cyclitrophicus ZF270]